MYVKPTKVYSPENNTNKVSLLVVTLPIYWLFVFSDDI